MLLRQAISGKGQVLTSDEPAQASAEILDVILAKSPLPPSIPPPALQSITINVACVIRAICSFPADSDPGPILFRANHLKEAVFCPSPDCGQKALLTISGTVNLLCVGQAPPRLSPNSVVPLRLLV